MEEYQRLEAAAAALDGRRRQASRGATARRRRAAPRAAGRPRRDRRQRLRARARAPEGHRHALASRRSQLVREQPGITIPELAETMGIKQNYLYRVLPELQKDGLVRKEGRGWHALEAA